MIEYYLYIILVTASGEKVIMTSDPIDSNTHCNNALVILDRQVQESKTTHYESVKTGCYAMDLKKVKI